VREAGSNLRGPACSKYSCDQASGWGTVAMGIFVPANLTP